MDLHTLRQTLRRQRRQLSREIQAHCAQQVTELLQQQTIYQQSRHIACYWPFAGEIDTRGIIQHIWQNGKSCYLPVVDRANKTLNFAVYNAATQLQINRYGILEPTASAFIETASLDLILLPLVAFDDAGHRLGTGAGYYDRTLQALNTEYRPDKPCLIGLAYEWQRQEKLTPRSWDVSLNSVITDQRVTIISTWSKK